MDMGDNSALFRGLSKNGRRFRVVLAAESERVAPLIAAEMINDCLQAYLTKWFEETKTPKKLQKSLLDSNNAILGTLGSRIMVARAFGLIDDMKYHALDSLRIIRNHCAHFTESTALDSQEIKSHLDRMTVLADARAPVWNPHPDNGPGNKLVWASMWKWFLKDVTISENHQQFLNGVLCLQMDFASDISRDLWDGKPWAIG